LSTEGADNSFDLSSVSQQALSHLQPAETPAPADAPAQTPAPAEQPPAATSAPQTYKVKVDGEEVEVPLDELMNGYSRTQKFTKTMMTLAEQRKAFEAEVSAAKTREQQINDFFKNPENVTRYYEYLTGQSLTPQQAAQVTAPAPVPGKADELATVATAEHLATQKAAELQRTIEAQLSKSVEQTQQWTQQQIAFARMQAEQQRMAQEYQVDISKTISSIIEQHPMLSAVDGIEDVLASDAMRLDPKNLDEAKQALLQVAQARAEKLDKHFKEMQKASAVERTKLQTQGIEPPGGAGVTPAPKQHSLGSKELTQAAVEFLEKRNRK
jgi:hypothetical protein